MSLFIAQRNWISLPMEFILFFCCSYFLDSLNVLISVLPLCTALKLALCLSSLLCSYITSVAL